jgi:phosphotransferase system enzyme I (PtsI)
VNGEHKKDNGQPSSSHSGSSLLVRAPLIIEGLPGSPGYAIGPALVIDTRRPGVVHRRIAKHVADEEMNRFDAAVELAAQGLREVAERAGVARAEASILEAYILMVQDETLREDVERRIRIDRQCAEWALDSSVHEMSSELSATDDAYLAERSHDVEFVGDRILRALSGKQRVVAVPETAEPMIVVAHDLSPADTAGLSKDRVLAMVTEIGTRTSHTAILARALEIPAVVGIGEILSKVGHGEVLAVDGVHGRVTIRPNEEGIAKVEQRARRHRALAFDLRRQRDRPAMTRCGVPVKLKANIELPNEATIAHDQGAQGIGLYRTEFLYVDRAEPPSEDEQYKTYRQVLETMAPLPVTLRTFDIGGDKFVSSFQVPSEMNPALGLRAVRLGLERPDLFLTQLRAMVRASAHGSLQIMVPMVAALYELKAVRELLAEAIRQVDAAGHQRSAEIPLGIMVEVPSAAILADQFAVHAEFLSIGTNDLVQYALAVDRSSRKLAKLGSFFDPAILRLIWGVVKAGQQSERPVTVCGAMASDPLAAILLIGMGLRELSMEASSIPEIKEALSRISVAEAETAAQNTLLQSSAAEIEVALAERFAPRMADLLDPELL